MRLYGTQNYSQRDITQVLPLLTSSDWMENEHHTLKKSLTLIADQLDVNIMTVHNYMKTHNIKIKRYSQSAAENEINNFIQSLNIETKQSDRTIISPLELDIYISSHGLAIEYCGLFWHADRHERIDNQYHKRKYDLCKEQGIQLITIFEDEWTERRKQVKSKLRSLLGRDTRERIFARKCTIIDVNYHTKKAFFNDNHIQGDGPGSIHIGLEYNDKLVAVMSFINQKGTHYLNRYATSAQVIGGFSKLLKYFQKTHKWSKVISFADQRWSNGNIYEKTGWTLDSILPPDYSYSSDGKTRSHKFNYRRKNLQKLLTNFDSNFSERVNCDNNGILRIWDCGKLRYIITNEENKNV